MSSGIGFSSHEMARFKNQLKRFSEKKTVKLQQATTLSAYNILSAAKSNVPRYQSRLYNSLRVIQAQNKLSARVWTNVEYAAYVEFGTKALQSVPAEIAQYASQFKGGAEGSFEELYELIKKWCKSKGIPKEAAYPITVKLVQKGQRAQPYLYPAFKSEIPKYIQAIKTIMNQEER